MGVVTDLLGLNFKIDEYMYFDQILEKISALSEAILVCIRQLGILVCT